MSNCLQLSLYDLPFLFVDCQTTGATPARAHLLEVGWTIARACDSVAPTVVSHIVALPEDQILPNRIQKITGISAADMQTAQPAAKVIARLQHDIEQNNIQYAVAHWAQFEKTFLSSYFADLAPAIEMPVQFICTCQIAKRLYPDLPSRAIRAVGGYFGLSVEEMKRSQSHVEITYFIWQNLVKELERIGLNDVSELLRWLKSRPALTKRSIGDGLEKGVASPGGKFLLPLERLVRLDLPDRPGVYRMLNSRGKILYVGKATSLKSRVNSYFTGRKGKDSKTKELISQVFDLSVSPVATPMEAALLENDLIKEHDPPYNRALKKRGRTLLYFDYNFASASPFPDDFHNLGPFPGGSTVEPLIMLVQSVREQKFSPALFWGLLDEEATGRAVGLFLGQCMGADITAPDFDCSSISVRKLLAMGLRWHRKQLLESLAGDTRGLSITYFLGPKASDDSDLDEGEEQSESPAQGDSDDQQPVELTDEDLVQMVRSLVTGAARAYALAGNLVRLMNASIAYEERRQKRRLTFKSGVLHVSEDIEENFGRRSGKKIESIVKPGPRTRIRESIDLVTYDRMRILLAEVRRVYGRGNWISLTEA